MGGLENHCPQMAMWGRSFSDKPNCFISGRTNKLWLLFTVIYPEYHPTHATYQGPAKSTAWQPSGGGGALVEVIWFVWLGDQHLRCDTWIIMKHLPAIWRWTKLRILFPVRILFWPRTTSNGFEPVWDGLWSSLWNRMIVFGEVRAKKASSRIVFFSMFQVTCSKKKLYIFAVNPWNPMESHGIPTWQGQIPRRIVKAPVC